MLSNKEQTRATLLMTLMRRPRTSQMMTIVLVRGALIEFGVCYAGKP